MLAFHSAHRFEGHGDRPVVITQNLSLMREAFGERLYRKICTHCGVGVRARSRNKHICPRCGGTVRRATPDEARTDEFKG